MLRSIVIFISVILVGILSGCSASIDDIKSKWNDEPITIDGKSADWQNKTFYLEQKNVLLCILNDSDYLYIGLTTANRDIEAQILNKGLIIWLDKEGEDNKTFGIKFPYGMPKYFMDPTSSNRDKPGDENGELKKRLDNMFENAINCTEAEILYEKEFKNHTIQLNEENGITAKVGRNNDILIYELKIALRLFDKNVFGIGIKNLNTKLGVGFETAAIEKGNMQDLPDRDKNRNPPSGPPPGNGPGNMPPPGNGPGNFSIEQFKYWTKVTLATK